MIEGFEANIVKPGQLSFFVLQPFCEKDKRYHYATKSCTSYFQNFPESFNDGEDIGLFFPNSSYVNLTVFVMHGKGFAERGFVHLTEPVPEGISALYEVAYVLDTVANTTGKSYNISLTH